MQVPVRTPVTAVFWPMTDGVARWAGPGFAPATDAYAASQWAQPWWVGQHGQARGGRDGTEALYLQEWRSFADLYQLGDLLFAGVQFQVERTSSLRRPTGFVARDGERELFVPGKPPRYLGNLQGTQGVLRASRHPRQTNLNARL